jgi:2'-5' RNA ligase
METIRFIIITLPPRQLRERLQRFQERLAEVGVTRTALHYPPHVTLRTGSLVPVGKMEQYIKEFGHTVQTVRPCEIISDGIRHGTYQGDGGTGYYVFYRIALTEPLLAFHQTLLSYTPYKKQGNHDFIPHLTLAFDDLTPEGRDRIMDYLAHHPELVPPDFCFAIDNVSLYIQNNGRWVPHTVFSVPAQGGDLWTL